MLGWHIAWNVLPSGDVLNHKNISVNLNCELCDNTNESLTRLFINDMTWCQQPRKFPYQQQSNLAINITFLIQTKLPSSSNYSSNLKVHIRILIILLTNCSYVKELWFAILGIRHYDILVLLLRRYNAVRVFNPAFLILAMFLEAVWFQRNKCMYKGSKPYKMFFFTSFHRPSQMPKDGVGKSVTPRRLYYVVNFIIRVDDSFRLDSSLANWVFIFFFT